MQLTYTQMFKQHHTDKAKPTRLIHIA